MPIARTNNTQHNTNGIYLFITISFDFLDYFQMRTFTGALVAQPCFIVSQFFTAQLAFHGEPPAALRQFW
ncbi:hypothetical protein AB7X32_22520, partial [Morganella morganii]|uniref:hypothetical protein n=1 Tax=Morganella morganii TaxID=582 RepID=UPI0034E42B03